MNIKKVLLLFLISTIPIKLFAIGTVIFSDNMDSFPTGWTVYNSNGGNNYNIYATTFTSSPSCAYENNANGTWGYWWWYMEKNIDLTGYDITIIKNNTRWYTLGSWQTGQQYGWVQFDYYNSSWQVLWSSGSSGTTYNPTNWIHFETAGIPAAATKIRFSRCSGYSTSDAPQWSAIDDVVLIGDHKPVLSWVGDSGYTIDGVEPDAAYLTTSFSFKIKYTDADNDAPASGYPKLHILKSGSEIAGSPFAMNYISGSYNTGAIYSYSKTLTSGNDYTYYFEATDGWLAATNTSTKTGPDVQQVIEGYVKDPLGNGMQNVTVTLSGYSSNSIKTISSGYYYFYATKGQNYTVTPSSFAYYSFTPPNRAYTNLTADQSNQDFTRNNATPTLSWTDEAGYTTDGVDPDYGASTTDFIWRIKYIDTDNDPPASGYPKVHILKGGVEIAGSPFVMGYTYGYYNLGAIYLYDYPTSLAEGDDYTYYFETKDIWNASTSNSSTSGPVSLKPDIVGYVKDPAGIGIQNVKVQLTGTETWTQYTTASGYYDFVDMTYNGNYTVTPSSFAYYSFTPANRSYTNLTTDQSNQDFARNNSTNTAALSWLGTGNYTSAGVDPEMGSTTTIFTYKINYTDPENDAPKAGYPKVHIKKGWPVGTDIAGSPFTMTAEVPGDINYIDGKIYNYSTTLSTGVDFTYYFETYDIWDTSSTATLEVNAPDVSNQPTLVWTGEPGYESDGINPEIGTSTTTFMYRITYKDPEADQPKAGYPKVHIKHSAAEISGSPFTMSYVSGNYDTGAKYKYEITLSTGIDYTYNFEVYDIWDSTGIAPNTMTGPLVKTIINGYAKDPGNNPMQNIKMTLTGDDTETYYTNSSGYYEFWITTMNYTVTPSSFAYYSFMPTDRNYTNTQTNQTNQDFIRTSTSPVLSWTGAPGYEADGIEPNLSTYTITTTYKIKYTDADNDAPAAGYPRVIISSGGVTIKTLSMNYESGNYLTGSIYSVSTLLSPCSFYNYSFSANDFWNVSTTSTLNGSGPTNLVSLMGYCYYPDNTAMRDITITLTDSESNIISTITNSSGYYQFIGLTPGLNYTVIPSSFAYYSFTPANRSYIKYTDALTGQNFTRNNTTPTLTFTNEENYKTTSVYPTTGTPLTDNFTFRILYTDAENDASQNGCWLHIINQNKEISGSPFLMAADSSEYRYGKTYTHISTFPYTGSNYSCYYEIKGIWNDDVKTSSETFCVSTPPRRPENKSVDAIDGGTVASYEIVLRWSSTDADNDSITYRLYVSSPQTEGNYNLAIKKDASLVNMTLKYEGKNTYYVLKNCEPGKTYFWQVDAMDSFGVVTESKVFSFKTLDIPTNKAFNYPNPFNPNKQKTRIVYKVNSDQTVKIKIYSEYGNLVSAAETNAVSGTNEFYYDGKDNHGNILYNGSYICRVEKAEGVSTCYILVIK